MAVFLLLGVLNIVLFACYMLPWKAMFFIFMACFFVSLEVIFKLKDIRSNGILHYCPAVLKVWFMDYSALEFLTDPTAADYISLYLPFMLNPDERELRRALRRLPYGQQETLLQRRLVDVLPTKARALLLGMKNMKQPKLKPSKHVELFLKDSKLEEIKKINKIRRKGGGKKYLFDVSKPNDPNLTMDILFHNKYHSILEKIMNVSGANKTSKNALISVSTILATISVYLHYYRSRSDHIGRTLVRYVLTFGSLSSLVAVYLKLKGVGGNRQDKNSAKTKTLDAKGFKLFSKFIHGK